MVAYLVGVLKAGAGPDWDIARLVAYRVQAQFSLAALYDGAAARTSAVPDGARP